MTREQIQTLLDGWTFSAALGLTATEADPEAGRAILRMPISGMVERSEGSGQFHGGALATLIDIAGDMAIATRIGGGVPTINLRIDYLRPVVGAYVDAVATTRRVGRTLGVADIDVFDDQGRLCAVGRGTYSSKLG